MHHRHGHGDRLQLLNLHQERPAFHVSRAEGRTIVLCSHLLYEVEQVCDAVTIFQKGRVVAQGRTKDLIGTRTRLEIRVPDMAASEALLRGSQWAASLSRSDGVLLIEGAGAYTATYSSVAFNGFPPLRTFHI